MENKILSEGECCFCNKMIVKEEMTKHLDTHLTAKKAEVAKLPVELFCHVEVVAGDMFLHLLVKGNVTMKKIDSYLRAIWLDCCGHLSAFRHKNYKIKMRDAVQDIFEPRTKIWHDYDFGTTTSVELIARKQYQLFGKDAIQLLSRNEPLKFMCDTCNKAPAETVCSVCLWNDKGMLCHNCSIKHSETCADFTDYAQMPLVNSPRFAECGYEGGSIDLARDGFWKSKIK